MTIPPPLPTTRPIKASHACPNCKTAMVPKAQRSGSFAIEIILLCSSVFFLFVFIPLGLLGLLITFIYSLSRATTRKKICSTCGNPHIIRLSTPTGRHLQKQLSPQYQNTRQPFHIFSKMGIAFVVIIFAPLSIIPFIDTDTAAPPATKTKPTPSQAPQPTTPPTPTLSIQTPKDEQSQPISEPLREKTLITETETHYWYQMPDGTTERIEKTPANATDF